MEWGFDGVLLNTAVALAQDPVAMAGAFADATQAGRTAYRAGAMAEQTAAQPSTPSAGHALLAPRTTHMPNAHTNHAAMARNRHPRAICTQHTLCRVWTACPPTTAPRR